MEISQKLTESELDALKEIGSIGAGHAATALSQLADKKIMITVPEIGVRSLTEIPGLFGAPEDLVAAIYMKLMGDVVGRSMLLFPRDSALDLANMLMKGISEPTTFLSEMDYSALKEAGNILTGSFVNALAEFLEMTIMPTVPQLAYDMVGPILATMAAEFGEETDYLFCLQTEFSESTTEICGQFLVIFDNRSLTVVLNKVKAKVEKSQKMYMSGGTDEGKDLSSG
ncbi:MAG: chemotaxis protein CheC [Pseudomonadota bacterium]